MIEDETRITKQYTDAQIKEVLAKLRDNPEAIRALISSAQGGSEADLRFIVEAEQMFWFDDTGAGFKQAG